MINISQYAHDAARELEYVEIFVKTALSKSNIPSVDYALNPYRGCEHQCVYCYSPYVIHADMEEWRRRVYVKRNIPTVLDRELKKRKIKSVMVGTVTDAYQPAERKYKITRLSLEVLRKYGVRTSILTKSSLVLRDKELIRNFREFELGVTITSLDERFRMKIEPGASTVEERIQVLEEFSDLNTFIFLGPLFPGLVEVCEIYRIAERAKVNRILVDRFRRKPGMVLPAWLEENTQDYENLRKMVNRCSKKYGIPTSILF